MRILLASTCLTPLALAAFAGAAWAETSVATKVTTPVRTSTAKGGSADDVRITASGSVVPAAPGAAVALDSNHSVKNEGAIQFNNVSDSTGILANAGTSGTITNSGKIELLEDYTPADADKDGDVDGAFATGARRFGIRLAPGGTFTGSIVNSGSIQIEGNDSVGIAADSKLAGSLTGTGTVAVTGDRAIGVRASEVTGDVRLSGNIAANGLAAVGVSLDGNVGGALVVQGGISSTGYRYQAAPGDSSKLDSDDLLQGGPALRVSGDVAKGILFDVPPKDSSASDPDEDKDGVEDSKEGTAAVISFGAAPAVQIGASDRSVTVGAVAGAANNGHGIVVNGSISGRGVYAGVNGNGIVVGGLGGAVSVAGGMTVNGTVSASSNGASATAVRIGSGATVNEIRVGGQVLAEGGAAVSRAILIDQGATVTTVRNSGRIAAAASGAGTAAAIVDNGGKLALIENSGSIAASGVALDTGRAVAIDLRSNNGGATVRQLAVGQGVAAPSISGNILFGAGDDLLDLADGDVKGTTQFGAGANRLAMAGDSTYSGAVQFGGGADRLTLAGTSAFSGSVDFGGGADRLDIGGSALFKGSLANAGGLAVNVAGGTFDSGGTGTTSIGSLAVGAQGILAVTVDPLAGKSSLYQVAGAASFAQGAKVKVQLTSVGGSLGKFTVLKAGSLSGTSGLTATSILLPVFLKSSLAANEQAGELAVTIGRKTAAEIGLNGSEAGAWDSVFAALDKDKKVAGAFLQITETDSFRSTLQQMLPEHAGGLFETVTQGSRATARFLRDPGAPIVDRGGWGFWLQQVAWGSSKDLGDTSAYDISGWGAAGGAELGAGAIGKVGVSLAFLGGRDENGDNDNGVKADQYEIAGYWRGEWGGLRAHARASAAHVAFSGTRTFSGAIGSEAVTRTAHGEWDGKLYSAAAGVSYELTAGRISLRPLLALDYYRLTEDGYSETGGGNAFDLIVDERTSDEFAGEASLTLGYALKQPTGTSSNWMRVELEGGRRQILGGEIGATTARFGTGTPFTLQPESRSDGWTGKLRLAGGSSDFSLGGEIGAEQQQGQGRAAVAGRLTLQMGF
jgi:hypothetical protein